MVWNCWALACSSFGQAFGPFGFAGTEIRLPDFDLSLEGLKAKSTTADRLLFWQPISELNRGSVNAMEGNLWTAVRSLNPSKVRLAQAGLGLELYFPDGIGFRCRSLTAPYLSWPDGSAGPGVPVPPSNWLLLSFGEAQPPIMMSFLAAKTTLSVEGRTGDWQVRSPLDYKGWVRFVLPTGLESVATAGVSSLGQLSSRVGKMDVLWQKPIPKLVNFRAEEQPGGVMGTWVFDRPGAMVPAAAHAARANGYMVEVRSPLSVLKKPILAGVRAFTQTKELKIFFPMLPSLPGKPLATKMIAANMGGPFTDPPGFYRQALQAQFLPTSPSSVAAMQESVNILQASLTKTPNLTAKPGYFDEKGRGYWELALRGWLENSLDGGANLDEAWRGVDHQMWQPGYLGAGQVDRTGAYLALAGFSGTTRDRVFAGMMHAGNQGRRGSGSLRVLEGIRKSLFTGAANDPVGKFWDSPIRVLSGPLPTISRTTSVLRFAFRGGTIKLSCVKRYVLVDIDNELDYKWEVAGSRTNLTVRGLAGKTTVVQLRDLPSHRLPVFPALPDYVESIQP